MFNTLIPQDHPENLRQLELPHYFHGRNVKMRVDHDRPLGTSNRDEPLIADPAQVVLVMELTGGWKPRFLLAVSTQTLVGQTCSTYGGSRVPWDEWGRDAVVVEVQIPGRVPHAFVRGAQVIVAWERDVSIWSRQYSVQTFEFSRRGRSTLQVLSGGGGVEVKSVLLKDEGSFTFEPVDSTRSPGDLRLLSDGSLFHPASCLSQSVGNEVVG